MCARPLNTVRLQSIAQAYGQSAALMAAIELGLFTRIDRGAETLPKIAAALELHPVNAERLLTMCLALDLIERDGERFRNRPDVERFLVEDSPRYAGAWILFRRDDWAEWGRLAEHLKVSDLSILPDVAQMTVEQARCYHAATGSIGFGAGRLFCRQVDLGQRRFLMDLGGGSGAYCIAAAERNPRLEAVVLDLPPVVEVAREIIAEHALADRVTAQACDFTSDPLPERADVAIMASNLPMYGPDVIARVVARVFDALLPGGEFHLIGEALRDDRTGPISAAFWGLGQALHHSQGCAHSCLQCIEYLKAAGFTSVEAHEFVPDVLTRISGRKAL